MSIKITIPNTSSDVLTFGSANTPTAAQIAGIDSGSSNGQLALYTTASGTSTERVRVDASGNVGIGTSSPVAKLQSTGGVLVSGAAAAFTANSGVMDYFGGYTRLIAIGANTSTQGAFNFATSSTDASVFNSRVTIDSSGNTFVGRTAISGFTTETGVSFLPTQGILIGKNASTNVASCLYMNRMAAVGDGSLIEFAESGTVEGTVSISGTTVTYGGGHLARFGQLPDGSEDPTLLKGTVLTNLDEMCVWINKETGIPADNEQCNKVKISDVDGDANVAGVFVSWSYDEQHETNDLFVAMTGDMIIRIAQGVTVARGDLLMSAGDGTAKPQGDDIIRSKTVAKVTSTHVTCTYADGSYCVPCVLMAC
jgi:hypothetical protein